MADTLVAPELQNKFLTPTPPEPAPLVESPAAEVAPDPVKPDLVVADAPETPLVKVPAEEAKPLEYLSKLSELSGGAYKFEKEDDLKSFFENVNKTKKTAEEFETKAKRFDMTEKWIKENADKLDPVKKAGGPENYKRQQMALALAGGKMDKLSVASQIVNLDPSKVNDIEVLQMDAKLKSPKMSDENALRASLRNIGIDTSVVEDWSKFNDYLSQDDKSLIQYHAGEIRDKFESALGSIEIPEPTDIIKSLEKQETERQNTIQENTKKWGEAMTSLRESFDTITFEDTDYVFDIPEEAKSTIDDFVKVAARNGIELNDANKKIVLKRAKDAIWDQNRATIMKAYGNHRETTAKKAIDKEENNLKPLGTPAAAPTDTKVQEAAAALRRNMKLPG